MASAKVAYRSAASTSMLQALARKSDRLAEFGFPAAFFRC
jgi:hypothetical protein